MKRKLLGWLKQLVQWLESKPKEEAKEESPTEVKEEKKETSLDVWTPKEREIYQHWDGQKIVSKDPMQLYRRMMDVGPELDTDLVLIRSPSKGAAPAYDSAVKKIRKIFDVKSLDEGGLGDLELFQLLGHFYSYCEEQKKSLQTSPIPPASMVESPNTSAESPPTESISPSGSFESDKNTASAKPSPTESQSPLEW